jgi:hypothetical protein
VAERGRCRGSGTIGVMFVAPLQYRRFIRELEYITHEFGSCLVNSVTNEFTKY